MSDYYGRGKIGALVFETPADQHFEHFEHELHLAIAGFDTEELIRNLDSEPMNDGTQIRVTWECNFAAFDSAKRDLTLAAQSVGADLTNLRNNDPGIEY